MEQQGDLLSLLSMFRRHWVTVLSVLVIGLVLMALALFLIKPVYTASSVIYVNPSPTNLLTPQQAATGTSYDSARVDSEIEMMATDAVLMRAIKQLDLVEDSQFGVQFSLPERLLGFLRLAQPALPTGDEALQEVIGNVRDALTIQRRGNTYVVSLAAEARNSATAAKLANAIADAYVEEQVATKVQGALASRDIVQSRIAEASDAVVQSETAYDDFLFKNLGDRGSGNLATLRDEIQELTQSGKDASRRATLIEQGLAQQDWRTVADELRDDAIAKLERDREALSRRVSSPEAGVDATSLKAQLDQLDRELQSSATGGLAKLRQEIEASDTEATRLRQQLRTDALNSDLSPEVLANLYQLQQSAENARTQYGQLLSRANELSSQAYLQVADSRIVSPAMAPIQPSFPRPGLLLALAGITSLLAGLGLAVVMERYVGGFTSDAQLEAVTRVPVVGALPTWSGRGSGGAAAGNVVASPHSPYAEGVRRLRIALDQLPRPSASGDAKPGGRVIAITSSSPGEGKSTLALSLARSSSLANRRTLVIDCDLRKPDINKDLGWPQSDLFVKYLRGEDANLVPERLTAIEEGSGATVITGSRSASLLADDAGAIARLNGLLDHFRSKFDLIVLDTPPVGPVADANLLVPLADIVLFVVKWASTPQGDVQAALRSIRHIKRPDASLLLVLNRQPARSRYGGGYAGYDG